MLIKFDRQFYLLNNQSSYLVDRDDIARSQINFNAGPLEVRNDLVEVFVSINTVGNSTTLSNLRQTVELGTPLKIDHRVGGFKLRLFEVKSFVEDTRSGLNYPSSSSYRIGLKVESTKK